MRAGLTKAQRAMVDAIRELTVDGVAPTYEELADRLRIRSKGHIASQLASLKDKGWVDYGRRARSIRIIVDDQPSAADIEAASTVRLRGIIEDAAEALAAQIGHAGAIDILSKVLANRRAMARAEAAGAKPGSPHRFSRKSS
jgi:SOS-response transcriptional repressor LexA